MSLHNLFSIEWTADTVNSTENYVAIGNLVDEYNDAHHAALIIKFGEEIYQFEFTGSSIQFESYQQNFYQKTTEVISAEEIPAFLQYCRRIQQNSKPNFGHFFSGTMYSEEGDFVGNTLSGERMTCVGFCLNVLNGFIEEAQYLNYQDWDARSIDDASYLDRYCERHNIDKSSLRKEYRRISPRELFVSAFFKELPITKEQVDRLMPEVEEYFRNRSER